VVKTHLGKHAKVQVISNSIKFGSHRFSDILIQIPFRILKNSNEEICCLFNYLHVHILFGKFCARKEAF
jgi:hypothetical protein